MTQTANSWTLRDYLTDVLLYIKRTEAPYAPLYCPGVRWHPIPFSGDVLRARVLTVGVNPSATEFKNGRGRVELEASGLEGQLLDYFKGVQTHRWYQTWSEALSWAGVSYQGGSAAHLDLSPRATMSMRKLKNEGSATRFTMMLDGDVSHFFELLKHCHSARALFLAGCAGPWYMNEFLMRVAPVNGFHLEVEKAPESSGDARVGFYRLLSERCGIDIPTFFCSVSPSAPTARQRNLLVERVKANRERISSWLR